MIWLLLATGRSAAMKRRADTDTFGAELATLRPGHLDRRPGDAIAKVLEEDDEWGTTTMRLRLLTWLRSFTSAAGRSGVLPGLRVRPTHCTSGYRPLAGGGHRG